MSMRDPIFVAGARGLVGSAIVRRLRRDGADNLLTPTHGELDLTNAAAVEAFFQQHKPAQVYMAAAKVGGILANDTYPADFLRINMHIQLNIIDAAHRHGVKKFLFLGSSCIYPKIAPQPIPESALLTGALEPTNSAYAIAKIAGIEMVQSYRRQYGFPGICAMPANLYGPGDNYDLNNSHVLPALMRKAHQAKLDGARTMTVWGSGTPRREFLYVDDLADACVFLMKHYDQSEIINVGTGSDIAIGDLAREINRVIGFQGELAFDASKPDGTPRKLLDSGRILALGWRPETSLEVGIGRTYEAFQAESWPAVA